MPKIDASKRLNPGSQDDPDISSNPLEPLPIVRAMILAYLKHHPQSSGYDLMKIISDSTGRQVDLQTGTMYSELRRLESMHLVSSIREESGRKRRIYTITVDGVAHLEKLATQMQARMTTIINPLLDMI